MAIDPLGIIGESIVGYQVVRFLGNGAAGNVYEGTREGRRYALKVYKEWLFETDEQARAQDARIRREADAGRIQHRNLCQIIEHGVVDIQGTRRRYLVMEYIDGMSLETVIGNKPVGDFRVFAAIGLEVSAGLHALHTSGRIHRDVKPANVIIEDGTQRVVLTDFGVVADLDAATLLTDGHEFLGTIAYAAPEWLFRDHADQEQSPEIDIYSLGATLFEMATGQQLFADKRNRHQKAMAVRNDVPFVRIPDSYPRHVASLIREMLAKTADGRPTLEQVNVALSQPMDSESVDSEQSSIDVLGALERSLAARHDIVSASEIGKLKRRRWTEFEDAWDRLAARWDIKHSPMKDLLGVSEFKTYWRGDERNGRLDSWSNGSAMMTAFPDRSWDWGRGFCLFGLPGVVGVEAVYFFHGLKTEQTGVTRFVSTLKDFDSQIISIDSAESWLGPLEEVMELALDDVSKAKALLARLYASGNHVDLG